MKTERSYSETLYVNCQTVTAHSKLLSLPNNRQLEFFEFGEPQGVPVLYHHGMPGSAIEAAALHDIFMQHGLKVISPNRPGIGATSPAKYHSLEQITADTQALIDHLGHSKLSVIGWSSGGVPALWLSKFAKEKVHQVILLSSYSHFTELEQAPFHHAGQASWLKFFTSKLPTLSQCVMQTAGYIASKLPKLYFYFMTQQCHYQDADILSNHPRFSEVLLAAQRQTFSQSYSTLYKDLVSQFKQWPFHLNSIQCPVSIFQGDCDPFVSERIGQHLADCLPNAEYHLLSGHGHLYWLEKSFQYRLANLCQI